MLELSGSRRVWVGLVGLGLLMLLLVTLTGRGDGEPRPSPPATASPSSQQQTLLIQVRNDEDLAADNVIVGVDGGLPAVQVLVPSRLVVDPPASAPQTLARTAGGLDRTASQDALRDLLALRIDGTLSLGRLALAGMVDFVGGITLDVDTTITTVDDSTGQKVVVVPAGTQQLDGTQAAAYALAWLPGEPESARLRRWSSVLSATVAALPDDPLRIEQMLTSLGGSARTTVSTSQVAAVLLRLRAGIQAGDQQVEILPTIPTETATGAQSAGAVEGTASPTATPSAPGTEAPSARGSGPDPSSPTVPGSALALVRVDLPAAQQLLDRLLPTALLGTGEARPRVLLFDGVGEAGLSAAAREDLSRAGFVVIEAGNTAQLGQVRTQIVVGTGPEADQSGSDIAEALDVPGSQVETAADPEAGADAVVVLGADFEPAGLPR